MNVDEKEFVIEQASKNELHISIVKCEEDCECEYCTAFNKIICGCDEEEDDYEDDEECEDDGQIVYGYHYNEEEDDEGELFIDKNSTKKVVEKPCKVCKTNLFDYEEICWKCGALNPTD